MRAEVHPDDQGDEGEGDEQAGQDARPRGRERGREDLPAGQARHGAPRAQGRGRHNALHGEHGDGGPHAAGEGEQGEVVAGRGLDRGARHRHRAGEAVRRLKPGDLLGRRPGGDGRLPLGPGLDVGVHDHPQDPQRGLVVALAGHVQHGAAVLDGEVAHRVAPLGGGLGLGRGGVVDFGDEAGVGVGGGDALDEGVQAGGRAVGLVLDDAEAHGGGLVGLLQAREHRHEHERQDNGQAQRPHQQDLVAPEPEHLVGEDGRHVRPPRRAGSAR